MTDVNVDMDDLDAFSDAFFEKAPEPDKFSDEEAPEFKDEEDDEVDENGDNPPAPETDEDEPDEEADDESPDEEDEPEDKPQEKKKSKFQQRIDELVTEARVAQRERDALQAKLAALEARPEVKKEETLRESLAPNAPNPDAVDDKGEPIYPLGEFDPRFIADITRFTINEQMRVEREERQKQEAQEKLTAEQNEIKSKWTEKVADYAKENPDYGQNVQALGVALGNLEPQYGEYLSTVIMQCDNGPAIMDYLSQNIGEAQKIVASGAHAATLAIGRLDARFEKPTEEAPKQRKRVSEAAPPPDIRVRGKGGQFSVRPDTDDLDAFEKEFFRKK